MTTVPADALRTDPVRVRARLEPHLSRWLWLIKWLLVLPHVIVLGFLWIAFAVLSVVAFVAILVTARYPRAIFEFNVGVLRWSWRVGYYAYGALGTDRYPPFTLAEVPDYPATLDIAYPEHLSRGLVLVKWWLLALPHYAVVAIFIGGGGYAASRAANGQPDSWTLGGGLVGLLVLIAAVVLLFTGRYPRGVFDLVLGIHRWVLRVAAYAALMTDAYPPFRLDLGGADPATAVAVGDPADRPGVPQELPPSPPQRWTAGRIVSVVVGSVLVLIALGTATAATVALAADRGGRDADGFLTTPSRTFSTSGYALVADAAEIRGDAGGLNAVIGDVRVRASGTGATFVGIGPAAAVESYLGGVARAEMMPMDPADRGAPTPRQVPGNAPATAPAQQEFWVAAAAGPGTQQATWTVTEGRWAVVVMNADGGRPVSEQVTVGATAPGLRWLWIGLYTAAGLALVGAALLVGLALPRRN
ncbi:DUF4389 domain-containing protein [Pseudonocardia sp. GCM10023141]|uniref:DUF4389 domain-containing protein n=1 Tax=Pseudonocardia sp. GCM10023141 TaxID=3252653 RepID=UPI00360E09B2